MKNAVYIISLGCAKNLVDTEVMCGSLVTNGYFIAADERDADICLINTCGFIHDARKESFDAIEWAKGWKGKSRRKIVVAGCLVQRNLKELREKYPFVDLFIGLDDVEKLPALLKDGNDVEAFDAPKYLYCDKTPRLTLTLPSMGYVKIAEGCDHRCAYCAIPFIRGAQRSRTIDSVEAECRQLLAQGARELNIIAQDTSRYGADLKDGTDLAKLLRRIDALEGDFWIRVLYTHPLHLTDELLEILGDSKHVLPYLDIPLQHISTNVLKAMNRGMNGPDTKSLLEGIRKKYPQMVFRTTFMVGFPGETEEDFAELLEFVKSFKFERMGAFAFSCEDGTAAAKIKDGIVPPEVAQQRLKKLLETQQLISLQANQLKIGEKVRVLLENRLDNRRWQGRTMADAPDVDQTVTVTTRRKLPADVESAFVSARVSFAKEYDLECVEE